MGGIVYFNYYFCGFVFNIGWNVDLSIVFYFGGSFFGVWYFVCYGDYVFINFCIVVNLWRCCGYRCVCEEKCIESDGVVERMIWVLLVEDDLGLVGNIFDYLEFEDMVCDYVVNGMVVLYF